MNVRLMVVISAPKMPNVSTILARINVVAKMVSVETDLHVQVLAAMVQFNPGIRFILCWPVLFGIPKCSSPLPPSFPGCLHKQRISLVMI